MREAVAVALVVMRLTDMHRIHPHQDNSKVCSRCGHSVGIYPSGQTQLGRNPQLEIVCHVCCAADMQPDDLTEPCGPIDVILQEMIESKDVGKA
jgi:hypothetical protein